MELLFELLEIFTNRLLLVLYLVFAFSYFAGFSLFETALSSVRTRLRDIREKNWWGRTTRGPKRTIVAILTCLFSAWCFFSGNVVSGLPFFPGRGLSEAQLANQETLDSYLGIFGDQNLGYLALAGVLIGLWFLALDLQKMAAAKAKNI